MSPTDENALPFDHDFPSYNRSRRQLEQDKNEGGREGPRKWAGCSFGGGRRGMDKRSLGARYRSSLRVRVGVGDDKVDFA